MTSVGKRLRLARLLGPHARGVIVPMDHGVSDGPLPGIVDAAETARAVRAGGADSIIVHKGLVRTVAAALGTSSYWLHVSASTTLNPDPNDKRLVATVQEAVRLGADGISVHVNVGAPTESRMVEDMGRIATECHAAGLPLLTMMYPRGHEIRDPHDLKLVKHVARLGYELGADVLKVPYTGDTDSFREVVQSVDVPVLVSGGPRAKTERDFLSMVAGSVAAGGAGVSVGRNLWQAADPTAMTRAIARLVHEKATVEDALATLGRKGGS